MAETYTSNLGLVKPDYDSPADISVINSNMDKIDNAVANAGKVKSVNGKTGDVVIDDVSKLNGKNADQYALKTDLPTKASDIGALASNGTAADSYKLDGKDSVYYHKKFSHPRNLLDNSYFANPVNQRGANSYSGQCYGIDRWRSWNGGNITTVNSGSVSCTKQLWQDLEPHNIKPNTPYTLAACQTDGTILCLYGQAGEESKLDDEQGEHKLTISFDDSTAVWLGPGEYIWAALYEGEYTADNLPPYVSKGYAAELAECQRYYVRYTAASDMQFAPGGSNGGSVYAPFHLPTRMRGAISLDYSNVNLYNYKPGGKIVINNLSIEGRASSLNAVVLKAEYTSTSDLEAQQLGCIRILAGGYIAFSADL